MKMFVNRNQAKNSRRRKSSRRYKIRLGHVQGTTSPSFGHPRWRCCRTLTSGDSFHEYMALDGPYEQAISRPLSYDELVQLQRIASKAGVPADLGRHGVRRMTGDQDGQRCFPMRSYNSACRSRSCSSCRFARPLAWWRTAEVGGAGLARAGFLHTVPQAEYSGVSAHL